MYGAKDVLDQLDIPLGEVKATAAEYVEQCCWFLCIHLTVRVGEQLHT